MQILDHGYTEQYEKQSGKKADWFTTNGDIFAVGTSKLNPFPPLSPNGSRSFPRKQLSRGFGEWNHYYIRAVNGEVRLWVEAARRYRAEQARNRVPVTCVWKLKAHQSNSRTSALENFHKINHRLTRK